MDSSKDQSMTSILHDTVSDSGQSVLWDNRSDDTVNRIMNDVGLSESSVLSNSSKFFNNSVKNCSALKEFLATPDSHPVLRKKFQKPKFKTKRGKKSALEKFSPRFSEAFVSSSNENSIVENNIRNPSQNVCFDSRKSVFKRRATSAISFNLSNEKSDISDIDSNSSKKIQHRFKKPTKPTVSNNDFDSFLKSTDSDSSVIIGSMPRKTIFSSKSSKALQEKTLANTFLNCFSSSDETPTSKHFNPSLKRFRRAGRDIFDEKLISEDNTNNFEGAFSSSVEENSTPLSSGNNFSSNKLSQNSIAEKNFEEPAPQDVNETQNNIEKTSFASKVSVSPRNSSKLYGTPKDYFGSDVEEIENLIPRINESRKDNGKNKSVSGTPFKFHPNANNASPPPSSSEMNAVETFTSVLRNAETDLVINSSSCEGCSTWKPSPQLNKKSNPCLLSNRKINETFTKKLNEVNTGEENHFVSESSSSVRINESHQNIIETFHSEKKINRTFQAKLAVKSDSPENPSLYKTFYSPKHNDKSSSSVKTTSYSKERLSEMFVSNQIQSDNLQNPNSSETSSTLRYSLRSSKSPKTISKSVKRMSETFTCESNEIQTGKRRNVTTSRTHSILRCSHGSSESSKNSTHFDKNMSDTLILESNKIQTHDAHSITLPASCSSLKRRGKLCKLPESNVFSKEETSKTFISKLSEIQRDDAQNPYSSKTNSALKYSLRSSKSLEKTSYLSKTSPASISSLRSTRSLEKTSYSNRKMSETPILSSNISETNNIQNPPICDTVTSVKSNPRPGLSPVKAMQSIEKMKKTLVPESNKTQTTCELYSSASEVKSSESSCSANKSPLNSSCVMTVCNEMFTPILNEVQTDDLNCKFKPATSTTRTTRRSANASKLNKEISQSKENMINLSAGKPVSSQNFSFNETLQNSLVCDDSKINVQVLSKHNVDRNEEKLEAIKPFFSQDFKNTDTSLKLNAAEISNQNCAVSEIFSETVLQGKNQSLSEPICTPKNLSNPKKQTRSLESLSRPESSKDSLMNKEILESADNSTFGSNEIPSDSALNGSLSSYSVSLFATKECSSKSFTEKSSPKIDSGRNVSSENYLHVLRHTLESQNVSDSKISSSINNKESSPVLDFRMSGPKKSTNDIPTLDLCNTFLVQKPYEKKSPGLVLSCFNDTELDFENSEKYEGTLDLTNKGETEKEEKMELHISDDPSISDSALDVDNNLQISKQCQQENCKNNANTSKRNLEEHFCVEKQSSRNDVNSVPRNNADFTQTSVSLKDENQSFAHCDISFGLENLHEKSVLSFMDENSSSCPRKSLIQEGNVSKNLSNLSESVCKSEEKSVLNVQSTINRTENFFCEKSSSQHSDGSTRRSSRLKGTLSLSESFEKPDESSIHSLLSTQFSATFSDGSYNKEFSVLKSDGRSKRHSQSKNASNFSKNFEESVENIGEFLSSTRQVDREENPSLLNPLQSNKKKNISRSAKNISNCFESSLESTIHSQSKFEEKEISDLETPIKKNVETSQGKFHMPHSCSDNVFFAKPFPVTRKKKQTSHRHSSEYSSRSSGSASLISKCIYKRKINKQVQMKETEKRNGSKINNLNPRIKREPAMKVKRPAYWATNKLYAFLKEKLEPEYQLMSILKAESFVTFLVEKIEELQHEENEETCGNLYLSIKNTMVKLKIVKSNFEFYTFCSDYLPFEVMDKLIPTFQPFTEKCSLKNYDPSKLFTELFPT